MFKIFDLGRDLPSLQAGLAELSLLHQISGLGIKNGELVVHFFQLIVDGAVAFDLGQGCPIIQLGNLFPEGVVLRGRPYKQHPESAR
jgi:hypothetical protein